MANHYKYKSKLIEHFKITYLISMTIILAVSAYMIVYNVNYEAYADGGSVSILTGYGLLCADLVLLILYAVLNIFIKHNYYSVQEKSFSENQSEDL